MKAGRVTLGVLFGLAPWLLMPVLLAMAAQWVQKKLRGAID